MLFRALIVSLGYLCLEEEKQIARFVSCLGGRGFPREFVENVGKRAKKVNKWGEKERKSSFSPLTFL